MRRVRSFIVPSPEDFAALLARYGFRVTAQRMAVHGAMTALEHASADMVVKWLRDNSDMKVTVASVYNVLSVMADAGIYGRRLSMDGKMYFDVLGVPHFHLYDSENHSFRNLSNDKLMENVVKAIGSHRFKGYRIERVDLQFVVKPTRGRR